MSNNLYQPLTYLRGVGPQRAQLLQDELGLFTAQDVLLNFPFRYEDRSVVVPIGELRADMGAVQIRGRLENLKLVGAERKKFLAGRFRDNTGIIDMNWFANVHQLSGFLKPGHEYMAYGTPREYKGFLNISHPEMELVLPGVAPKLSNKILPVYSLTDKLTKRHIDNKVLVSIAEQVLELALPEVKEILPADLLQKYKLMPRREAFQQIHFPDSHDSARRARDRFKFEELFMVQLKLLQTKVHRTESLQGQVLERVGENFNRFFHEFLPYELTGAQKRVIKEIRADMRGGKQMNRLLQGDVGSGKTVVGLMSMLIALDNDKQAAMLAPTEILATQHFNGIHALVKPMGLNIKLLTGSTTAAERRQIAADLSMGTLHMLVGTHAVLEDWVGFPDLGLVIIDEQHRFGVAQRAKMWAKNDPPPHMLVMTATPIPRTLAMTLYGDLDASVIDEMPPGRKPVLTLHKTEAQRAEVFGMMKREIAQGRQVYVVYPLIEESEKLDYLNLEEGYLSIERSFPKPQYQISILHGRMDPAAKEFEMQRFKKGETQIMVSTTVIEVGVDVPNATLMVIEGADRFGLSQLHQLRGRVGRGGNKSTCILMTGDRLSNDARRRLEVMCRTNNGFEISEEDLQLRGPGNLAGTKQSGVLDLKIANLNQDQNILYAARLSAQELLARDPHLLLPEHEGIAASLGKGATSDAGYSWSLIS